mmetsp:Transcript_39222/g.123727  ORF Transcript_39222/g.123727 Transcript_39222/m.123727 type:complete len:853 (-) Transcript_39222:238-2796(-)
MQGLKEEATMVPGEVPPDLSNEEAEIETLSLRDAPALEGDDYLDTGRRSEGGPPPLVESASQNDFLKVDRNGVLTAQSRRRTSNGSQKLDILINDEVASKGFGEAKDIDVEYLPGQDKNARPYSVPGSAWSESRLDLDARKDPQAEEFQQMKIAVEQILEFKVRQRKEAQGAFKWDMISLAVYLIFLIIFSVYFIYVYGDTQTRIIYDTKSAVENIVANSGGYGVPATYSLSSMAYINDIYTYLSNVIVPVISLTNLTKLDPRCEPDGRSKNQICLTPSSPLYQESLCCLTIQPNPSVFVTGGNVLMNYFRIRQLRVRQTTNSNLGVKIAMYPSFDVDTQETHDGGGTLPTEDPTGLRIDWPSGKSWYRYTPCYTDCYVEDSKATLLNVYTSGGYVAWLNGTTEDMLAEVQDLKKYEFIDESTRALFMDFAVFFPARNLFSVTTVLIELTAAGGFYSSYVIRVSDLRQSMSQLWIIWELCIYGYALGVLMIIDIVKLFRRGIAFFRDGWNYLSMVKYSFFVWGLFIRVTLDSKISRIGDMVPQGDMANNFPWLSVMYQEDFYNLLFGASALLSWIGLLNYVEAISPGTRELTGTLAGSASHLKTFVVLLFIFYVGYSKAFTLAYGSQLKDFSSIQYSMISLFQIIIGQSDYQSLANVHRTVTPILFISFVIFLLFIMLNMFLAVVMKTYDQVHESLADKSKNFVTGTSLMRQKAREFWKTLTVKSVDELLSMDEKKDSGRFGIYDVRSVFDRENLTKREFQLLFRGDEKALDRMGVKTVEELLSFADVSGDPKLSVNEVREHREKIKNMERNEVKTLEGADLEGLKQQIAESMLQGLILHFSSPPSQLTPFA